MKRDYKVGDLVTWVHDGDVGIITHVNKESLKDEKDGLSSYPFWVVWFNDPGANGWHPRTVAMKLVSSS